MTFIMNEYDIDDAVDRYLDDPHTPNLSVAVNILDQLRGWTNLHSDGWPYWSKPSNAATKLQRLIDAGMTWRHNERPDVAADELRKAVAPIKAFLTRQARDSRYPDTRESAAALRADFTALLKEAS